MTPNLTMEQLSLTYVRAVAARAGYQVIRPEPDIDSVDGILLSNAGQRPRIDFQAKATSQDVLRADALHYPLPVKNYNDLRAETISPRILVVLLMPSEDDQWISQSEEELCIRYCAYWYSLEGQPSTTNTNSITVQIPSGNVFTVDQLTGLMAKVERGESLC